MSGEMVMKLGCEVAVPGVGEWGGYNKRTSHTWTTHTHKKNESERKKVHCEDDKRQTSSVFVGINKH